MLVMVMLVMVIRVKWEQLMLPLTPPLLHLLPLHLAPRTGCQRSSKLQQRRLKLQSQKKLNTSSKMRRRSLPLFPMSNNSNNSSSKWRMEKVELQLQLRSPHLLMQMLRKRMPTRVLAIPMVQAVCESAQGSVRCCMREGM